MRHLDNYAVVRKDRFPLCIIIIIMLNNEQPASQPFGVRVQLPTLLASLDEILLQGKSISRSRAKLAGCLCPTTARSRRLPRPPVMDGGSVDDLPAPAFFRGFSLFSLFLLDWSG